MLIKSKHMGIRGFSLVEVLVVMALLGLVTMATMSLYLDTQRNTNTSEEVVDVQQNVRIAMDQILRDIRFAGLLIPSDEAPIAFAPQFSTESDSFTIQTASTTGRLARISQDPGDSPSVSTDPYDLVVASADMVDLFDTGDFVRIIRPIDGNYPLDRVFQVKDKDRSISQLTLENFNVATTFQAGDAIIRIADASAAEIQTISYFLQDDPDSDDPAMQLLFRRASDEAADAVLANNITNLQFSYLMDDNTEVDSVPTATRLDNILGVRVTITGATDVTRTGNPAVSGVKTRALEGVAKIRNLKVQD